MSGYCTADDLSGHVLQAYLDKLEALKPGLIARHIAGVTQEIDDRLRKRFVVPLITVPATIRRITAVLAAYRVVGAITSVMRTEADRENSWLPLQTLHKQALKELDAITAGDLDLGLELIGAKPADQDCGLTATSAHALFPEGFWRGRF